MLAHEVSSKIRAPFCMLFLQKYILELKNSHFQHETLTQHMRRVVSKKYTTIRQFVFTAENISTTQPISQYE